MSGKLVAATVFFDTNVLVYAYDRREPAKQRVARALLEEKAVDKEGAISTQVVQEFCNVGLSKLNISSDAMAIVIDGLLGPLLAHTPSGGFYKRAIVLQEQCGLHFYDTLILQAALDLGCSTLYSEDLQDGQTFGTLMIKNPFK